MRPPILFISLDATRFDYLVNADGDWRWPFFQKFAKRAHTFLNAYTPSPWTPPAHASMFTGLTPHEHGVVEGQLWLGNQHPTLAGFLDKIGYQTVGISSNPLLGPITNLNKDFRSFFEVWKNPRRLSNAVKFLRFDEIILNSTEVIAKAIELLNKKLSQSANKPVFLFLQLIGPHTPYAPTDRARSRQVGFYSDEVWTRVQCYNKDWRYFYTEGRKLTTAEQSLLQNLYRAELDDLNDALQTLFRLSWFQHVLENGHIIITADHGEMLGEQAYIHHLFNLHQPLIHVPLLWKTPGQSSPRRHIGLIQHQHLFPLLKNSLERGDGFLKNWDDHSPATAQAVLSTPVEILEGLDAIDQHAGDPFRHSQVAILNKSRKIIGYTTGVYHYYNLNEDPDKEVDVSNAQSGREKYRELKTLADNLLEEQRNLTPQINTLMQQLGYF